MRHRKTLACFMVIVLTVIFVQNVAAQGKEIKNNTQATDPNDGYFYSFWNQGGGSVVMTLGSAGNYSVTWSSCTNFTCGKGWRTGSSNPVCYSGTFNGGSNGYLALYGWTKNPLVEYYIVESYGAWTPPGGSSSGTLTSDGGTYNIHKTRRTNAESIIGRADFDQYWSVRTSKRTSGTITVKNHFDAWESKGMKMGSVFDYEIMETEGYQSSGSSNITVQASCSGTDAINKTDKTEIRNINANNQLHFVGNDILVSLPANTLANQALVQIFNFSGKKLFSSTLQPCNDKLTISNANLSPGTYCMSIQSKGSSSTIPFVKTK